MKQDQSKTKQKTKTEPKEAKENGDELEELQAELEAIQEREKRALADYQNLVRRQRQERAKLVKFSTQDLINSLLQPLEHLSLAAEKIDEAGLNMVVNDLWQVLKEEGLEEIRPQGEEFDLDRMEAVNTKVEEKATDEEVNDQEKKKQDSTQEKLKVKEVIRPGYKLHNKVIQHAKVLVE